MNLFVYFIITNLIIKAISYKINFTTISRKFDPHRTTWSYDGEKDGKQFWKKNFKFCRGKRQSPINIDTSKVIYNDSLNLKLMNYDRLFKIFIENNGHTVHMGIHNKEILIVTGSAAENKVYVFEQLHLHWGDNASVGSEHTINNKRFSLEVHMVHYNQEYHSFDRALHYSDGLLVLSILYLVTSEPTENDTFSHIIENLKHIPEYRDQYELDKLYTLKNFLPNDEKSYFRYFGSLTTPTCLENVLWIMFANLKHMSLEQDEAFRKEKSDVYNHKRHEYANILHNFRGLQDINGRKIESSFHCNDTYLFDKLD